MRKKEDFGYISEHLRFVPNIELDWTFTILQVEL